MRAGPQDNAFAPTSVETVVGAEGNAVDATSRAFGGCLVHEAGAAAVAGAVHVEKGDRVAVCDGIAVDVGDRCRRLTDGSNGNMPRYQRVRHSREFAVPKVDVGSADFGCNGIQDGFTAGGSGLGELADLNGCTGCWDEGGAWHGGIVLRGRG